ncbi:hypothetical protein CH272_05585 [Rhodococcus sp. 05-340-1]|nr:hypothetical protein CH271_27480 [Rhodococcus sp. 05-340-2]OZD82651.1 hypothetical protein CH272_05585 [Rhodococcus sp. 05-340-1]
MNHRVHIRFRGCILARDMRLPFVTFALSVLVGSLALSAAPGSAAPGAADFYSAPVLGLEAYASGSIVRREPVPQLDLLGSHTERILYRSADPRDRAVAVSGLLITPTPAWRGPGPRPVIAYAPGSYGIADRCSGSSEQGLTTTMPALLPLLAQGYQVVTTDYQGLGTPGEYEFLGRVASARALLDAARTAASETDAPVVLYGYSAGGVASAAAAELASTYAPDLAVVGAFVGAAPTDPVLRVDGQDGSESAATMLYTIGGLIGAHPDLSEQIRALFNDRGRAALDAAQNFCTVDALTYGPLRSEDLTADGSSLGTLMTGPVLGPLTEQNTIGFTAPAVPVMIVHGVHDTSVEIAQSRLLAQRWRAAEGTDITVREFDFGTDLVPAVDHTATNIAAYPELLEWIARLVTGV